MKNQKGFSLLELLMSLFIVFVLATIGYSQYVSSWENAQRAAIISNMHTVQLCVEDFCTRADGVYPGGLNTMVCQVSSSYLDSSVIAGATKPPYPIKANIPDNFINPIDSTHDAIKGGLARKPAGCVYYAAYDGAGNKLADGQIGVSYKITAMGPYRPIELVLLPGVSIKKEAGNEKK